MNIDPHQLNRVFHALSDNTRRDILVQIRERERSVNDIASQFTVSLPAISKHLSVLEEAGLIQRIKRGRMRFCRVEPERLENVLRWLTFYQSFWTTRLDALANYLEQQPPPSNSGE